MFEKIGAPSPTRTNDLLITKPSEQEGNQRSSGHHTEKAPLKFKGLGQKRTPLKSFSELAEVLS